MRAAPVLLHEESTTSISHSEKAFVLASTFALAPVTRVSLGYLSRVFSLDDVHGRFVDVLRREHRFSWTNKKQ
jgi:hypothetical protein